MKQVFTFVGALFLLTNILLISSTLYAEHYAEDSYGNYDDESEYDRDSRYDDSVDRERERRELDRERRKLEYDRERLEEERRIEDDADDSQEQEVCPRGFSPSENKCSQEERRNGCKDMRLPGGLGCVKR